MARIVFSFAAADWPTAQRIARLLEDEGFDVLPRSDVPGEDWDAFVGELGRADVLVVLWSRAAADSVSVAKEAQAGRRRGVFFLVLLETVPLPSTWRELPAAQLADWDGSAEAPQWRRLVDALRTRLASERPAAAPVPSGPSAPVPESRPGATPSPQVLSKGAGALAGAFGSIRKLLERLRGPTYEAEVPQPKIEPPGTAALPDAAKSHEPFPAAPTTDAIATPTPKPGPYRLDRVRTPEVLLGVSAPRTAAPGSEFSARFVAYIDKARGAVREKLEALGDKDDRIVLDIPSERGTQWRVGAPVTVRLSGEHLTVTPAESSFEWNGRENLVSFVVRVADDAPAGTVQVCFHVFLSGLPIAFIPVAVTIAREVAAQPTRTVDAELTVPSSAFASYASKDSQEVARSLSTLAHWAPRLDIFQDCLDLEPNGDYRTQLVHEIATRDVFLLFWSRNAAASDWVRWELKTAQETRGPDAILPMPLEDPAIAPPPPGLEGRHMRDRFMMAGYGLSRIAETAGTKPSVG